MVSFLTEFNPWSSPVQAVQILECKKKYKVQVTQANALQFYVLWYKVSETKQLFHFTLSSDCQLAEGCHAFYKVLLVPLDVCSCCQIIHMICLTDHWTFSLCNPYYWSPQMALFPQTMSRSQSVCQNRIPQHWAPEEANALQQFVLVLHRTWV